MIPEKTKIQSIDLKVKSLESALTFYSELLGFKQIYTKDNTAELSSTSKDPYLIKLTEDKDAITRTAGSPGLYHLALRLPNRKELARVFLRLFERKIKFQGFSDHLVSEAIYLSDPEGNGIELYSDKPRSDWKWINGEIQMDSLPLDLSVITNELDDKEEWNGIHPETELGHIHLNVSNLFKAEKFYSHMLGFNVTTTSYPGALFLSAGKYHHHIGTNVWLSRKGIPFNEDSAGMSKFTINIPDKQYIKTIEDNARKENLLIEESGEGELEVRDFDSIPVRIVS